MFLIIWFIVVYVDIIWFYLQIRQKEYLPKLFV